MKVARDWLGRSKREQESAGSCWDATEILGLTRLLPSWGRGGCKAGDRWLARAMLSIPNLGSSGLFLYPPGGFIPWHNNMFNMAARGGADM